MGKNKLSSGLINVVTYDTNSNISLNSGSNLLMSLSGSGTVTIPGNLVVLGGISGSTAESASYSLNADKIDNLDSTQLVLTSSFNSYTSSASSSLGSLSGSVATTTSNLSSSIGDLSGSVATTTSGLSSIIGNLSSSVATTTSVLSSSIGSLSSSVATTTSGLGGRITTIEGNYATTGSNIFVGSQVITGSLYITNDMVVQGCSCLQNITASAVSIGTNTVVLNTATPAVRFAGISVQDSGSNAGVTGSIFWDGLCNKWVYSNPSGVGYSGGMLLSGPRTSTLGSESPLTCNYIAKSGGGDHLYDSCIIDDGTTVCVNATLKANGQVCSLMGNFSCVGVGTNTPITTLHISNNGNNFLTLERSTATNSKQLNINIESNSQTTISYDCVGGFVIGSSCNPNTQTGFNERLRITGTGIACFACQVCAPNVVISNCLGVGVAVPQGNFEAVGLSYFTRASNSMLLNPNYGGANTHSQIQVVCNMALSFATNGDNERMRITNSGFVGIGNSSPSTTLHTTIQTCWATNGTVACSYPVATFSQSDCAGGARGLQIGVPTGGISSPVFLKVNNTSARFSIIDQSNCENFTISGNKVGIGTTTPCARLETVGSGFILRGGWGLFCVGYTDDGLFSTNAQPNFVSTNAYGGTFSKFGDSSGLILGYQDNGAGLYSPAYGFEVRSTDGRPVTGNVVKAIVMRDTDTNQQPFWINNNGGAYFANRVGIRTTDPNSSSLLHVKMCSNSNGDGIRIQAVCSGGAGSQPGIAFANVSDAKRWAISLDNSSDIIQITNATGLNALQINQGGSVVKPLQAFVYGGLASDQTISTSNPTKVNFVANVGHFGCNVGGYWNNSTYQLTAPTTGVYLVNISGYWSGANIINQFAAFVNSNRKVSIPTGYCTNIAGGSMMVPMAAGETMDFRVYNDVGTGTLYQNVYHTFFSIYLLG